MLAEKQRNIPNMVKYSGDAIGHFQSFHFLPLVFFCADKKLGQRGLDEIDAFLRLKWGLGEELSWHSNTFHINV